MPKKVLESCFTPIEELHVDKNNRKVTLNVIQTGWSKNGNLWTEKHLQQMKEMIEVSDKKSYDNHKEKSGMGRSLTEWIAIYENPKVVQKGNKSVLQVTAEVFEYPDTAQAVWERILKAPEQVGVSVDVMATGKKGTFEGVEGFLPEDVVGWNSADFVDKPSAGGGIERIGESCIYVEPKDIIEGAVADTKLSIEFEKAFNDAYWAFERTTMACLRDKEKSVADKKSEIAKYVDEFKGILSKLAIPKIVENNQESISIKEGVNMTVDFTNVTIADLKQHVPHLIEAIGNEVKRTLESEQAALGKDETITTLTSERDALQESVVTLTAEKEAAEKTANDITAERDTLKEAVSNHELAEKAVAKKVTIDKLIEEAELPKEVITDEFKESLVKLEGEDFEDQVKAKIVDRKAVWESALATHKVPGFSKKDIEPKTIKTEGVKESALDKTYIKCFGNKIKK